MASYTPRSRQGKAPRRRVMQKARTSRRARDTGMQPEVQQELLKLLRRLMQDVDAKRFFNEAVDPDALGIPEYREIIKEPMDLGTIFWKLKDDTYKDVAGFFSDLHLVWRNCQTFNLQGSPVYVASEKLCEMFESWWNRVRKVLKMEDDTFSFAFRGVDVNVMDVPAASSAAAVEGGRSRRLIVRKTFDDAFVSQPVTSSGSPTRQTTASKLKIKLGRGAKRGAVSKGKGGALFNKGKEKMIDAETMKRLDVCISILEKLNHSNQGVMLEQASLQTTFVPSLQVICVSLIEAKNRNWARSPYGSSKDVLHEAGLYLRSQAVKNEHRKKIASACQTLVKTLEKLWSEAGFAEDLEMLKGTDDDRMQESGWLPESNLRVTKARMEKIKRQEMEKEVKEAEEAIQTLEEAKTEVEQAKIRLDKAKETLKETTRNWNATYRAKLMHLTELGKSKAQAQKQKEKAQSAIKASQVAIERLREKESALQVLKQEEESLLAALEDERTKLEVFPKDAVLVDVRHYAKKQKTVADTNDSHIVELGKYWLSMKT